MIPERAQAEPAPRSQMRIQGLLVFVAALFLVAPLVATPRMGFLRGPYRVAGIALALLVVVTYGVAFARKSLLLPDARGFRLRRGDVLLLIAFPVYFVAMGNGTLLSNADNLVTRMLGRQILLRRTLDVSDLPPFNSGGEHYSAIRVGGRLLPSFPIGTGLLSVPYVAVALVASGGEVSRRHLDRWEKHLSALLACAAAAVLFGGLRQAYGEAVAAGATFVFAFGTTALSAMSQALWSTTGEVFFLCLALWLLLPAETAPARLVAGGLVFGAAFLCRPTALMAALVAALVVGVRRPRDLRWFLPSASVAIGMAMAAYLWIYRHPFGGYGLMNREAWNPRPWVGLAGNLISPSRGLLVYFPYLAVGLLGWREASRDRSLRLWMAASLLAAGGTYLAASVHTKWWGGWSIGPRLMTEAAPFLALLTVPAWLALRQRPWWRIPFLAAIAFSVTTQLLSIYTVRGEQWNRRVRVDKNPAVLWSVKSSQLMALWCPGCPSPLPQSDR